MSIEGTMTIYTRSGADEIPYEDLHAAYREQGLGTTEFSRDLAELDLDGRMPTRMQDVMLSWKTADGRVVDEELREPITEIEFGGSLYDLFLPEEMRTA